MAKATKEQMDNIKKWQKENVKQYAFRVNKEKYPEIVEKLEQTKNLQGYIIGLVLNDIHK